MKSDLSVDFTAVGTDRVERETFIAAALTVGFELADNTPKISNVYQIDCRPEPGQAGDVRFYLPTSYHGLSVQRLAEIWLAPEQPMRDAEGLPARISSAGQEQDRYLLNQEFEMLYLFTAVAHIRFYSKGRISIPDVYSVTDEEQHAADQLDRFQDRFIPADTAHKRQKLVQDIQRYWKPAMVAWIKAYRGHLLELKNLWREAPTAIKIERPGQLPIILPKGKNFATLLKRWT